MDNDQFDEWLADYDARLAQGQAPPALPGTAELPLSRRLAEASACLELLESVFPRQPEGVPDEAQAATALAELFPQPAMIGRFMIRRELGRGGHGVVFLAFDPLLKREVALKVPRSEMLPSPEFRRRFRREAEAAARLEHPHLIPVYETGEIGPICYLVSAYCPGPTLATWLRDQPQPIQPQVAIQLIVPLAEAVDYMHRQGILHRDIKPGNVILQSTVDGPENDSSRDERHDVSQTLIPRITDFGLAHIVDETSSYTRTGTVLGTPGYMAPEQTEGVRGQIGPATDVYALGVLLYELLTGRIPFQGATEIDTLRQIQDDEPLSPRRLRRDIPRDLEAIVLKCLEKSSTRRFASAKELADELHRFMAGQPVRTRAVGTAGRSIRWCQRHPAAAGMMAMTATALLLVISLALVRNRELTAHSQDLERLNRDLGEAARQAEEQRQIANRHARQVSEGLYAVHMSQAAAAVSAGDTRDVATLLEGWIPQPGQPDFRGFEYFYLQGQVRRRERSLLESGVPLYIMARAVDGKMIAAGGQSETVWLFDESSGALIRSMNTGQIEVNGIAFSPDGSEMATAGDDGTVRFWNLATGDQRLCAHVHPDKAFQIVYVDQGRNMALCGNDPHIRVIDTRSGELQYVLKGHTDQVQSLVIGGNGQKLISTSSDQTTRKWDLATRSLQETCNSSQRTGPVEISAESQFFFVGNDAGTVELHRFEDGHLMGIVEHLDNVKALAVQPNGRLLAAGDAGGSIRLWRLRADGEIDPNAVALWHGHEGGVTSLLWSANKEHLLSAGSDGRVVMWNVAAAMQPRPHSFSVAHMEHSQLIPHTDLLVGTGSPLTIWNWRTGSRSQFLPGSRYWRVSVSADGQLIAATTHGGDLRVFGRSSSATMKDAVRFEFWSEWKSDGELTRLQIAPDSRTIAVARWLAGETNSNHEHAVWIASIPDLNHKEQLPPQSISQLAFSPDGRRLALRTRDGLAMWDLAEKKFLWQVPQADVEALTFSPDGERLFSRFDGRSVIIRQANDGAPIHRLTAHLDHVTSMAVTDDGRTLATASADGTIRLTHLPTGRQLFDLQSAGARATIIGFSSDQRSLVCLIDPDAEHNSKQIVVFETDDSEHGD